MRIEVCDDLERDRSQIIAWLNKNHPEIKESEIFTFQCGESAIDYLSRKNLDILFLDCQMPGYNCIETAKKIKESNIKIKIVIVSSYKDYALFGYNVGISRYLLKEEFELTADNLLEEIFNEVKKTDNQFYTVRTANGFRSVPVPDILYIESQLRIKRIYLIDGTSLGFNAKLDDVEAKLSEFDFVRVHGSYIVNSRYVHYFNRDELTLEKGRKIVISRKYSKQAYELLMTIKSLY